MSTDAAYIIISYEKFICNKQLTTFLKQKWDRVICDEGQHIKGDNSVTAEYILQLIALNKWVLTGKQLSVKSKLNRNTL